MIYENLIQLWPFVLITLIFYFLFRKILLLGTFIFQILVASVFTYFNYIDNSNYSVCSYIRHGMDRGDACSHPYGYAIFTFLVVYLMIFFAGEYLKTISNKK